MIPPSQIVYLFFVGFLTILGAVVIIADLCTGGKLHITNALVGGISLILAIAMAIPLRLKDALALVAPYLDKFRGLKGDD